MRSAAGWPVTLVGVRPHDLRGPRHGHPVRLAVGPPMFWVVLSIVGLAVETALIIVLGCRATERYEPAENSAPPTEEPWAPG
jgi:hypothetical protein